MARGALAESARMIVEQAQVAQALVRLLEMPADRFIVLDGLADPFLDPVRQASVQLGARLLEQAAVRRVADQCVMEAQGRLADEPAGGGLDQLAAAQRPQA